MENPQKIKKKYDKNVLFIGVIFIILAFICFAGVVYCMLNEQKDQAEEITVLKQSMLAVNAERDVAESQVARLEKKVGQSVSLEKLLDESEKYHDPSEAQRTEGYLWIDRKNNTLLATLGLLNGALKGVRLGVYDGNRQVGYVRVEFPLDVISYVYPVSQTVDDFKKDYYRVVLEE